MVTVDDSGPLTYDSVSLCEWPPKFQKNIVSSSSSFQDSKRSDAFHYAILLSLLLLILICLYYQELHEDGSAAKFYIVLY
jgi:hypothetical protein